MLLGRIIPNPIDTQSFLVLCVSLDITEKDFERDIQYTKEKTKMARKSASLAREN